MPAFVRVMPVLRLPHLTEGEGVVTSGRPDALRRLNYVTRMRDKLAIT